MHSDAYPSEGQFTLEGGTTPSGEACDQRTLFYDLLVTADYSPYATCCFDAGVHTINCYDTFGDSWCCADGACSVRDCIGFLEIDGTNYCQGYWSAHKSETHTVVGESTSAPPSVSPSTSSPGGSTIAGDPHLTGGHGDRFDFKGLNASVYSLLSTKTMAVNALFTHDTYSLGNKEVHGSFITACYATVQTQTYTVRISYNATRPELAKVTLGSLETPDRTVFVAISDFSENSHDLDQFEIDTVQVQLSKEHMQQATLTIKDGAWAVTVKTHLYPYSTTNVMKKRLDLAFAPISNIEGSPVAPHGLIGQTFDGDGMAIDGAQDDYTGKLVITKAMGEGAIEGVASDYLINNFDPFSTHFKYSRFGVSSARPRDISKLNGLKRQVLPGQAIKAGAFNDVPK